MRAGSKRKPGRGVNGNDSVDSFEEIPRVPWLQYCADLFLPAAGFVANRPGDSGMNRRRLIVILAVIALLLGVAAYLWASGRPKPLIASGTVEAHNIRVGSKVGGRLDKVLVREGDSVEPGQLLVTFDDKELKANLDASRANLEKLEHGYRVEEIQQARDQAAQARADYLLKKRGYRQEGQ